MTFEEKVIIAPDHDFDVVIKFPGDKDVVIQARPSNADIDYNGSLDIILPDNGNVTCWEGDDMKPSRQVGNQPETRWTKQLVMELPGIREEEEESKPNNTFTKDQIKFIVTQIFIGVADRIESSETAEREEQHLYCNGAIDAASRTLACLYAQTTGEGMGMFDWEGSPEFSKLTVSIMEKTISIEATETFIDAIAQQFADAWQVKMDNG